VIKAIGTGVAASFLMAAAPPPAPARTAPQQAQPVQRPQPAPQGPHIPTRVNVRTLISLCGTDNGACLTYVLGAADAYASALVAAGRPQVFCFPAGTANQQIAQSAVQYLRARPQEGNNSAALGLLAAFSAIYPCPR
jgi:Rap1a immunity proteins